jgi:two-component sensor histidine kinase
LNIYKKDNRLICEIEDNGVGREASALKNKKSLIKKKSMGMQITSKRMELAETVNQIKSTLEIIDKKDKEGNASGTKVILSLPYKSKSNT